MGYMGFGMRKEDYKRKPKRAFSKLKEIYGEDVNLPKSNIDSKQTGPISFEKHSYKPFYERRFFIITKRILFLSLFCTIIWLLFLQDLYIHYQRKTFEEKDFVLFYNRELQAYNRMFNFIEEKSDRVVSARYDHWNHNFNFTIKYHSIPRKNRTEELHYASFLGKNDTPKFQFKDNIVNDTLILTRTNQLSKSYSENWIYSIRDVEVSDVPSFVHSYIGATKKEFTDFTTDVKFTGGLTNSSLYVFHDSLTTTFNHEKYGDYEYLTIIGKLDDDTYWLRKETVKR